MLFFGVVLGAVLLVAGFAFLSRASFWQITNVAVSGTLTVSSSALKGAVEEHVAGTYLYLFAKDNILLYPKHSLVAALMTAYPSLRAVEVRAHDFNTLAVDVIEREPKALWCAEDAPHAACKYIDEEGTVYALAQGQAADAAFVRYWGKQEGALPWVYIAPSYFRSLTALVDALAQKESEDAIVGVYVDVHDDVEVLFESGAKLYFVLSEEGGDVFERYLLALASEPFAGRRLADFEYLDLRFGDRLYYKLNEVVEVESADTEVESL